MLTLVIQAGGASRRMGQDKALLPFLGQPLIQRVIERVAPLAQEVIVTTNQPEHYRFLNLPLRSDLLPGRGALGGLYTALSTASHPLVAVVACDMPFVSSELLALERNRLQAAPYDAVLPSTPDGLEPFHAVYRKQTCLPLIEAALQADRWRVDAWFSQAHLQILSPEETARYNPQGLAFWNVNTPEEFAQAESIARQDQPPDKPSSHA